MAPTEPNQDIEELVKRLPATANVLALRAAALADQGEARRAELILREAISSHPVTALRVTLARVLVRREQYKEAMTEMVSVLRSEPQNSTALLVLTTCLIECGELERGGKMLRKAHAAGAPPMEIQALKERWHELVARSTHPGFADLTLEDLGTEGAGTTRPQVEGPTSRRRSTLMGSPNRAFDVGDPTGKTSGKADDAESGKPRRLPPPPLQSGTFAGLETYDIDGDDDLDMVPVDDVPTEHLEYVPDPTDVDPTADDIAAPDDRTSAMSIQDSDIASPDDQTAYIAIDDSNAANTQAEEDVRTVERSGPSIQYDASFKAEAQNRPQRRPPADLDELPEYQSELPHFDSPHVEEDPTAPDFPPTREEQLDEYAGRERRHSHELPGLDPSVLFDDEIEDSSKPPPINLGGSPNSPARSPRHQGLDSGAGSGRNSGPYPAQSGRQSGQQSGRQSGQRSGRQSGQRSGQHSGQQHRPGSQPQFQQPPSPRQQPPQQHAPQQRGQHNAEPLVRVHQPSQQQAQGSAFELEGNQVPLDARWQGGEQPKRREETAVAAEPKRPGGASTSIRFLVQRRWPVVIVILLALVVGGFLAVTIASGMTLNSKIEAALTASTDARAPDTYNGYLEAEKKLIEAIRVDSFMGEKFDNFVEQTIPIPGLSAARLRRTAVAELAWVSGVLEHRFTSRGEHKAAERVEIATERAPKEAMTAVGRAYVQLTDHRPYKALATLEAAASQFPDDFRVQQARAWTLLELGRTAEAAKAVQPLREAPALSVHQKFLLASVDAARGDESAAKAFAEVFGESEEHVDSRLARSYALRGGEEEFQRAEKVLNSVFELTRKTSRFQKARAVSARGALYLAEGDEKAAEERFRDAISKMPNRSEIYLPLLEFLLDEGRREDLEEMLKKAREENAYSPGMALIEARLHLLQSKPEEALEALEKLEFEDARTIFLEGLALLDLRRNLGAVEVLEEGQTAPGDSLHVRALHFLARALAKDEAVEDSVYQLERIKSKNADSAVVHWAAAVAQMRGATTTTSKKKRAARLKAARRDLERAIELQPNYARAHVALCEVWIRDLEAEKGESACLRANAIAPDFAPGMIATARLRLLQGDFEEARKLSDRAAELRPDDPVAGLLKARVAIEQRRLADARKELNGWLGKKSVDKYELSLLEGRLEFTQEHYTKAAGYLKEAFEMRPDAGEAAVYYGHTLARLGEYDEADDVLLEYLDHPTWSGYAWATLGEVRREQRRFRDAFENLAKARRIYSKRVIPDRYVSHLYAQYALTYRDRFRRWRHRKVYRMLERGREEGDPNDPELNMTFGLYYLEKRRPDYEAAMRSLEKVVEHAPFRCDAIETLERLYEKAEKEDELEELAEVKKENCAPPEEASDE